MIWSETSLRFYFSRSDEEAAPVSPPDFIKCVSYLVLIPLIVYFGTSFHMIKLFPGRVHAVHSQYVLWPNFTLKSSYIKSWIIRFRLASGCGAERGPGGKHGLRWPLTWARGRRAGWCRLVQVLVQRWSSLCEGGVQRGGFLSGLEEQVCKLNLGRFHPPPHPWQCDGSVSWLVENAREARFFGSGSSSSSSLLPGDSVNVLFSSSPLLLLKSVSDF